jgi:hypothetical protein
MIIYNVTTKIDWSIANEWVKWMQEEHIPAILAAGHFSRYQFAKLVEEDNAEGPTYAVQYFGTLKDYNDFIQHHAETFRKMSFQKWKDKFISFKSLLEIV